jgi:hypothetical protein
MLGPTAARKGAARGRQFSLARSERVASAITKFVDKCPQTIPGLGFGFRSRKDLTDSGEVVRAGPLPQERFELGKYGKVLVADTMVVECSCIPGNKSLKRFQLLATGSLIPAEIHPRSLLDEREKGKNRRLQG